MTTYVTAAEVYRITGLPPDGSVVSENDVTEAIVAAQSLVERYIGTSFSTAGVQITETYDGDGTDTLLLNYYPIKTIDELTINGTNITVGNIFVWNNIGKIRLKNTAEVQYFDNTQSQNVVIKYTYGETISDHVKEFIRIIAGISVLIEQIGGTFDDITSFSMPEMSGSLGEPYTNIREAIDRLIKLRDWYLNQEIIHRKVHIA